MRAIMILGLVAVAIASLVPMDAAAQRRARGRRADLSVADQTRVMPYFLLGFGGEADASSGGFGGSADLDATVGLGGRVEVPVHDYVVVGGLFEWSAYEIDNAALDNREHALGIDPFVKGRYVLDAGGMPLELSATMPVGVAVGFFERQGAFGGGQDDTAAGWNIGLLFGGTLFVTDSIGITFELGFMHYAFNDVEIAPSDVDIDMTQGRMNFGVSFAI